MSAAIGDSFPAGDKPPHYGLRYVIPAFTGIHLLCATCHWPWRRTSPRATVSDTSFPRKRESIFFAPPATSPGGGQAPALRSQVRLSCESGNPSSLRHLPPALAGDKPPRYGLRYVFPAKAGIHLLCATCHWPWRWTSPRTTVSGTSFPRKQESIFFAPPATGPDGGQAPALQAYFESDSTSPVHTSTGSARTAK